jgi:hypothetical protein
MKQPFLRALGAAVYIILIVLIVNGVSTFFASQEGTLAIPMTMLSLFVLSAAVMGYLFLAEPISLLVAGHKREAIIYFGQIVACFAGFVALFAVSILILGK